MKLRTKEEMAAYRRELRARQKAQPVTPKSKAPVTPVTPAPKRNTRSAAPGFISMPECSGCRDKMAEIVLLRDEVERLKARLNVKPVSQDEAEALRQRVLADKVNRLNNLGKGHNIGTARL